MDKRKRARKGKRRKEEVRERKKATAKKEE
jgi:hypothetical protein